MPEQGSEQIQGVSYAEAPEEIPSLQMAEKIRTPLRVTDDGRPTFVISKHDTTPAFTESPTHQWIDQSITCICDPLGITGETLIGKRRAERPQAKARPAPSASLEEETFKALFPIFAHPENEWLLSALVEGIANPNILGWIYKELHSIPDKERFANLKKKILLNPSVPEDLLYSNCIFCNVKQAQVIDSLGVPRSAVSIHNDYPFGPIMHKVLILQQRKHDISEITAEEIFDFYELLYRIATDAKARFGTKLDGLTYGMNYGLPRVHKGREIIASGASQPHLHSQVSAITKNSFNTSDRIGTLCKVYREKYDRDYLMDYWRALEEAKLVLFEDINAILYVPIAQRFNYEVQIMIKEASVGNILDTSKEVRRSLGHLEHLAYQIYQHPEVNIQSFNTVLYATRFSARKEEGHRLILSIYPRTTIIALSELVSRNVVDSFPWDAAAKLRGCMEDVQTQGVRKLSVLAIGAHPDDIELGCGGLLFELAKRKHDVHALIVTDGCGGSDRDPGTREQEANDAAKVLGVKSVAFGRIRDGQAHLTDAVFNVVKAQIDRHHPGVVLFHANIESEHSDHKNISEVVKTVCARQKPRITGLTFEGPTYNADASFKPHIYVDIGLSMETKKEAVTQHKSEIARKTINLDQVEQRARLRATEIGSGASYAEAFAIQPLDVAPEEILKLMPFLVVK